MDKEQKIIKIKIRKKREMGRRMDKLERQKERLLKKKYIIGYYATILCVVFFLIAHI